VISKKEEESDRVGWGKTLFLLFFFSVVTLSNRFILSSYSTCYNHYNSPFHVLFLFTIPFNCYG